MEDHVVATSPAKRVYSYPWDGKVKKTDYAPRAVDARVPPPQPAIEEEDEHLKMQISYDSDTAAESFGEHTPALRVPDLEDT